MKPQFFKDIDILTLSKNAVIYIQSRIKGSTNQLTSKQLETSFGKKICTDLLTLRSHP